MPPGSYVYVCNYLGQERSYLFGIFYNSIYYPLLICIIFTLKNSFMCDKITCYQMFVKFFQNTIFLEIYDFNLQPRTDESNGANADAQSPPPPDGHDRIKAEIIAAKEQVHVC